MSEVGAEAGRTPCPQSGGQEDLPHVRGQGQRPRMTGCDGTGTAERSYPASEFRGGREEPLRIRPRSGAIAERNYPTSEVRGSSREEQPHVQGAVAVQVQEGLEEPSQVEG